METSDYSLGCFGSAGRSASSADTLTQQPITYTRAPDTLSSWAIRRNRHSATSFDTHDHDFHASTIIGVAKLLESAAISTSPFRGTYRQHITIELPISFLP
jgi:cellulose synthase/poly-beta-1,6-N-acetylglucosamine synthase-like glycosyltransferase